jgi:dihydropyrimidinase
MAVIDYSFHGVVQHVNDDILQEMYEIVNTEGIPSFKIYMTYDCRVSDSGAFRVIKRLGELGGITAVHAENHDIINYLREKFITEEKTSPKYHAISRPIECEGEAVNRIIEIALMAGNAPVYIVHVTGGPALIHIARAVSRGQYVFAETCPQYLLLDKDKYDEPEPSGLKYVMSPPLRDKANQNILWEGIKNKLIQVVATDHCPFSFHKDKMLGKDDFTKCPNGVPGIEERVPLMFSEGVMKGRISVNRFVEVCCTNPAKILGLYPKKGTIAPGSDGDIVIIDPHREVTLSKSILHGNSDYTAYEGFKLKGYPVMTISKGEIVAKDNEFTGAKGRGEFIKRKICSDISLL